MRPRADEAEYASQALFLLLGNTQRSLSPALGSRTNRRGRLGSSTLPDRNWDLLNQHRAPGLHEIPMWVLSTPLSDRLSPSGLEIFNLVGLERIDKGRVVRKVVLADDDDVVVHSLRLDRPRGRSQAAGLGGEGGARLTYRKVARPTSQVTSSSSVVEAAITYTGSNT